MEWFREEHYKIPASHPSKGRGILFTHIPIPEYLDLWNNAAIAGTKNEGVACGAVNTGVFAALKEQPTVEWVTCGHDHNNDYWGHYQGINLAFGRKTGFGSYGPAPFVRGARIFEFTEAPYSVDSWIREDGGNLLRQDSLRQRGFLDLSENSCLGLISRWD